MNLTKDQKKFSAISVTSILLLTLLFTSGLFEIFEVSTCKDNSYTQSFDSWNEDNYKYTQTLTSTAELCYPASLPIFPTEGDVIKLECNGKLYIDTTSVSCGEDGCAGENVDSTYDYIIKADQEELHATCWAKKTDRNVNDKVIWVWSSTDIYFSFDGVNPLVVDDPTPDIEPNPQPDPPNPYPDPEPECEVDGDCVQPECGLSICSEGTCHETYTMCDDDSDDGEQEQPDMVRFVAVFLLIIFGVIGYIIYTNKKK